MPPTLRPYSEWQGRRKSSKGFVAWPLYATPKGATSTRARKDYIRNILEKSIHFEGTHLGTHTSIRKSFVSGLLRRLFCLIFLLWETSRKIDAFSRSLGEMRTLR